jgi:hypothetical protein
MLNDDEYLKFGTTCKTEKIRYFNGNLESFCQRLRSRNDDDLSVGLDTLIVEYKTTTHVSSEELALLNTLLMLCLTRRHNVLEKMIKKIINDKDTLIIDTVIKCLFDLIKFKHDSLYVDTLIARLYAYITPYMFELMLILAMLHCSSSIRYEIVLLYMKNKCARIFTSDQLMLFLCQNLLFEDHIIKLITNYKFHPRVFIKYDFYYLPELTIKLQQIVATSDAKVNTFLCASILNREYRLPRSILEIIVSFYYPKQL